MCTGEISFDQSMSGNNKDQWMDTVYEEMKCLVIHDTWEIVEKPADAKVIGSRIILRDKHGSDNSNVEKPDWWRGDSCNALG